MKYLRFFAILLALLAVQPNMNLAATQPKIYTFTSKQLFPDPEDLKDFTEPGIHSIKGIILDVSTETQSLMKIKASDGEEYIVFFYPNQTSSATRSELLLAVKPGRKIEAQIARAGASTVNLISAKIHAFK